LNFWAFWKFSEKFLTAYSTLVLETLAAIAKINGQQLRVTVPDTKTVNTKVKTNKKLEIGLFKVSENFLATNLQQKIKA